MQMIHSEGHNQINEVLMMFTFARIQVTISTLVSVRITDVKLLPVHK